MLKRFLSYKNENFNSQNYSFKPNLDSTDIKLQLREEKLDISKNKVKTGDVKIYKKIINEDKTITVPVVRQELVIEKHVLSGKENGQVDIIRIPISEEHIEILKHPVNLENVDVYNNQFEDIKQIEITLKKEKFNIKTSGDATVIDNQSEDFYS